jgi:predicted small lipoprotein YifL
MQLNDQMHVHTCRTLAVLIALSFMLGACGNRTPLTLPKPAAKPPAAAPVTAPAPAPARNEAQ